MTYQIQALPLAPFTPLFELDDEALMALGARRQVADTLCRAPCRVSLMDAEAGDRLVLLHHPHLSDPGSPYRAAGPIFVREAAVQACPEVGEIPPMVARRSLSIRIYDAHAMMIEGELVAGTDLDARLTHWFAHHLTDQVHIHSDSHGCYLARAVRPG